MKYFVYAIKSQVDGRIYIGFSSDIEKRLKEHNSGKTKSTKGFRPGLLFLLKNVQIGLRQEKRRNIIKLE